MTGSVAISKFVLPNHAPWAVEHQNYEQKAVGDPARLGGDFGREADKTQNLRKQYQNRRAGDSALVTREAAQDKGRYDENGLHQKKSRRINKRDVRGVERNVTGLL